MTLFVVGGVVFLFNCGMNSSARLTWMFIIAILPITGAIFLFFTRRNLGHRRLTEREDELIRQTHDAIPQPEGVLEKLEGDGSGTEDLVTYLNRSGCFPVYASTEISYFPMGEDKSTAMLEAIPFLIFREGVLQQLADTWGKS